MKIGIITGEYPPDLGGVGDFSKNLGLALLNRGVPITVITNHSGQPLPPSDGLNVDRIVGSWTRQSWAPIAREARDLQLDILNIQYQAAGYKMNPAICFLPMWAKRWPCRVVTTFHDLRPPDIPKTGILRGLAVWAMAHWSDAVIVTNIEDEARLRQYRIRSLWRIPIGSNIPVSPPRGYDRDEWRTRRGVRRGDILLGYFGLINPKKGVETIIRALDILSTEHLDRLEGSTYHLVLIGDPIGSDRSNEVCMKKIKQMISDRGLTNQVHWTDRREQEEVSACLASIDIYVLPFRDGVSFRHGTLIAGLAHGLPIVTTNPRVPIPELIPGENCILVPPDDPSALAIQINLLAADRSLRQRIGTKAAQLHDNGAFSYTTGSFKWDRIADETARLFERLM